MKKSTNFWVSMPEPGVLVIRRPHDFRWVEVRGVYEGPEGDLFQAALCGLTSPHVAGLFAGDVENVYPGKEDYEFVLRLWEDESGTPL
jgi:hypothetical protein